ncbi:MAG: DegV family protein [Clostridium sp.]
MEKIKIITDSTIDLPKELVEKLDIEVLPVLINFGEESYLDGVEIKLPEVFRRIEAGDVFPTTAQITPNRFVDVFEKYLSEGYKILNISMSSGMSGTYNSACLAKEMIGSDDIYVIDSQTITFGLGLIIIQATKLRDSGMPIADIAKEIEEFKGKVMSSLSFECLDNLVKGGRIPKAVSVITGVLGIRLILEVKDGVMAVKDKVRGGKKASKRILKDLESFGYKEGLPVIVANLDANEVVAPIKEYLEENNIEYIEAEVGCSVGIHAGNHVSGIFFACE